MAEKATQTGVVNDEKNETVEAKIDTSSLDFMEQIAERNNEVDKQEEIDLAKEEGREPAKWAIEEEEEDEEKDKKDEVSEEEEEDETDKTVDEEEEEEIDKDEVDEKDETTDDDPEVEIVVDGVKTKVKMSKIVDAGTRTLQKESAADKRLEEATTLLKEAKKEVKKTKAEETDTTDDSDEDIKALRLDYIKKTQYGEPEEAVAALEKWETAVLKRSSGTAQDTETTPKDTDLKTAIRIVNLEEQVFAPVEEGGYKDLFDSPILKKHTAALVDTLVEQGDGTYDSFDTYKKAGDAIRRIANTLDPGYVAPKVKKPTVDSLEKKKKKKEKIINLPANSSKATIETSSDDDKEQTVQDVIADMRKNRGQ